MHTYVHVYNRKADIISRFWQTLFRIFPRVQISCSLPTTAASDCRASFLPHSQFAQLTFFLALNTCKSCLPFLPDRLPLYLGLNSGNYNKTTTKKKLLQWEFLFGNIFFWKHASLLAFFILFFVSCNYFAWLGFIEIELIKRFSTITSPISAVKFQKTNVPSILGMFVGLFYFRIFIFVFVLYDDFSFLLPSSFCSLSISQSQSQYDD